MRKNYLARELGFLQLHARGCFITSFIGIYLSGWKQIFYTMVYKTRISDYNFFFKLFYRFLNYKSKKNYIWRKTI